MNIIEAVKLIKTGKKVKRKGACYYEIYDGKKGWLMFFLEDDVLADDWEVVE